MIRIHAVMTEEFFKDSYKFERVIRGLLDLGIRNINMDRLRRHGIVTGDLPDEKLGHASNLTGIQSVSIDKEREI